jgi:CheY-like chemotaxis protein
MQTDQIYGLTARGERELNRSGTTLSAAELALLVRIDSTLSVAQLKAAVPENAGSFERTFEQLSLAGLIAPVELDTFAVQLQAELDNFSLAAGGQEADAGLRSLQRAGFYVRIARPPQRARPSAPGQPLTAVVVEDDPNLAKFVGSYLAFDGFEVRTAANRAEVLEQFRRPPVADVVLLDVMLPDIDGFAILASLRRHPAFREVPVIMLTGKATREAVLQGLAGGADGYVTKPFEPDALLNAVHTVMGRPPAAAAR